jgi:hypothetical protein
MEPLMSRPRERVCLQDGLKLDLNRLARKGFIKHGANIGVRGITWTHSYWGEIASGTISADMSGPDKGWFRIQLGSLDQRIILLPRARHFGGRQWYFMCPAKERGINLPCALCGCVDLDFALIGTCYVWEIGPSDSARAVHAF